MWKFELDCRIPTKKNRFRVHWNQRAHSACLQVLSRFKKPCYWIAPAKAVKDAETIVAWTAKHAIKKDLKGPVKVTIHARGRNDIDGFPQVVLDGLEKSGRIENDSQVKELHVFIGNSKKTTVEVSEL